jgi:hypothetical protein
LPFALAFALADKLWESPIPWHLLRHYPTAKLLYEAGVTSLCQSLRKAEIRGLVIDPTLAIGDGALGFWKAVRQIWPKTREQRCWVHKTANILDALPKSQQPSRALSSIPSVVRGILPLCVPRRLAWIDPLESWWFVLHATPQAVQ